MAQAPDVLRRLNRGATQLVRTQAALIRHPESARGRVLAGLIDAGMSSLGGLMAGLYAAHFLSPALLGGYSIYFVAFLVTGYAPVMLYLMPVRVTAMEAETPQRLALLRPSLLTGVFVAGAAGALTPLAGVAVLGRLSWTEIAPFAITAGLLAWLSPLQDHLRGMLHLAGRPWLAASVSAARLATLVAVMVALHTAPIAQQWVPFGSVAIACAVSLAFGLLLIRHDLRVNAGPLEPISSLLRSGWPLLVAVLLPFAAQFAAGGLIAGFSAIEDLGYAEAARQIAQPIHVAALGLGQALTPMIMQAALAGSRPRLRRPRRIFIVCLLACAAAYAPIVALPHGLNPFATLLPNAYHNDGLVLASIVALVLVDLTILPISELAASRSGRLLLLPTLVASLAQVAFVAAVMLEAGAFAVPLGIALNGAITAAWTFRLSNGLLRAGGVRVGATA